MQPLPEISNELYKHGKTSSGSQRYRCLNCQQTFTSTFDTIYYRRQVTFEEVQIVLQSHCEGTSWRGISRISGLSYNTGVSLIRAASQKAQMVQPKYKLWIQMRSLPISCGRLSKKTKALLTWRTRNRRLLDRIKLGTVKRFDSHRSCG